METFVAQFDDYALSILDISNTCSHALHKHEFIGMDGAVIDNMGRRPQEIKFKTFWFGTKHEFTNILDPTYSNHFLFVDDISDSTVSHTLTHPKYGEIKGYVESYTILHNDTQEYVEIDINFVEKDIQNAKTTATNLLNLSAAEVDMLNSQIDKTGSEFQSTGLGQLLGKAVDFSKNLNSQFNKLTVPARNFLKECDSFLNQCDMFLNNVTQPAVTVDSLVSYASDVPSHLISSMNQAANRIVGSASHLSNLPVQMINNMILQTVNFSNTITGAHASFFQTHLLTVCAGNIAVQVGTIMQADNNNRDQAKKQESLPAFDSSGRRINTVTIPILLSVPQIETISYQIRDLVEKVLKLDRDNAQLLSMMSDLTNYIANAKLNKLGQVSLTTNNIPIHVLCLQLGIPYNAADRIYALNSGILNPTFVEGKIQTYTS